MWYETELFIKTECLVKIIKKYFLKKLSIWLVLVKVVVLVINYQKRQCIYKRVYFILKSTTFIILKSIFLFLKKLFFFLPILANNNLPLKSYCENIVKNIVIIDINFNLNVLLKLFFSLSNFFFSRQY